MSNFTPTPQQQAIIDMVAHAPSQSLMVDALAGSSKTTTIELAATAILQPTLAVAFNKRIADELKARLPARFDVVTLNGLGHRAWSGALGGFSTVDTDKMGKIATQLLLAANITRKDDDDAWLELISLMRGAKSKGLVPQGAPMGKKGLVRDDQYVWEDIAFEAGFPLRPHIRDLARKGLLLSISQAYSKLIDFDDQIYMSVLFGGTYPKYHTVIVDEAQDLSPLNHQQLLRATETRLIAVGDPHQAIYAFRGADDNSMTNLMEHFDFERLPLTFSFRVPHLITARQRHHVPAFESWPTLPQGEVKQWHDWSLADLPDEGFVLCRNNAPLMALAFGLIKLRRPVKILGVDIGVRLGNLLNKICLKQDLPIPEATKLLEAWRVEELERHRDSPSKASSVEDRYSCLLVLLEASGAKTSQQAVAFVKDLFKDKAVGLTLASGHKSKGLEKDWVLHLDPWRIPSRQAKKAAEHGNFAPLAQENNLRYVIETRAKLTLVLADLEHCLEMEGA